MSLMYYVDNVNAEYERLLRDIPNIKITSPPTVRPCGAKSFWFLDFDEILGISNIFAASKIDIGKAYMERIKPQKAVLIGDTIHDREVADALGVDCILIASGHQSKEALMLSGAVIKNNLWEVKNVLA